MVPKNPLTRASARALVRERGTMGEAHNVFISWSGERSRMAAEALRDWLPVVLPASKPWMSKKDIEKGSQGLDEVGKALEMRIGIVCLTPENLDAHWILYEAGALSKTLGARVCTFLLGGLKIPGEIPPPLGLFQATRADDMQDTGRLIHDINKALGPPSEAKDTLDTRFGLGWPMLAEKLSAIPVAPEVAKPARGVPEMVAEILELSRTTWIENRKVMESLPTLERLAQALGNLPTAADQVGGPKVVWVTRGGTEYPSLLDSGLRPGRLSDLALPSTVAHLSDGALAQIGKIVAVEAKRETDLSRTAATVDAQLRAQSEEAEHVRATRFEQKVEAKKKQRDQGK